MEFLLIIQKSQFGTLTRMLSYNEMSTAVTKIVKRFNWEVFGFFFHNYKDESKGYSSCHHILAPVHKAHSNNSGSSRETFDDPTYDDLKEGLGKLKEKSRSKSGKKINYFFLNLTIFIIKINFSPSLIKN